MKKGGIWRGDGDGDGGDGNKRGNRVGRWDGE
jgi:hypothetical protein